MKMFCFWFVSYSINLYDLSCYLLIIQVFFQLLLVALRVEGPDDAGDARQFSSKSRQTGWRDTYNYKKIQISRFMENKCPLANQSNRMDCELIKKNIFCRRGKIEVIFLKWFWDLMGSNLMFWIQRAKREFLKRFPSHLAQESVSRIINHCCMLQIWWCMLWEEISHCRRKNISNWSRVLA